MFASIGAAVTCTHQQLPPPTTACPWCQLESSRKESEALRQAVDARDALVRALEHDLMLAQGRFLQAEGGRMVAAVERDEALRALEAMLRAKLAEPKPLPAAAPVWTFEANPGAVRSETEELRMLVDALRAAIRVLTRDLKNVKCPCGAEAMAGTVAFFCIEHAPSGAFILDRKGGNA